jgi:hypothetical protein
MIIPDMDFSRPAALHPQSIVDTIANHCAPSSFGSPIFVGKNFRLFFGQTALRSAVWSSFFSGRSFGGVAYFRKKEEIILDIAPNAEIFFSPPERRNVSRTVLFRRKKFWGVCQLSKKMVRELVWDIPLKALRFGLLFRRTGLIGHLEERNLLPLGQIGEIIVEGSNVTESHDQLPEKKRGWRRFNYDGRILHRMGDLEFLDEKRRIWFCGRKMERVITDNGEEYSPESIEPLFQKYSAVKRAALIKIVKKKTKKVTFCLPSRFCPRKIVTHFSFGRHKNCAAN